ncbi:MAG: L-seryl-tRNA(Sec) selenium transferase, partial [Pseudomonadota bacterium]
AAIGERALGHQPHRRIGRHPDRFDIVRPVGICEIEALCRRLAPALSQAVNELATVEVVVCASQIGSGALPVEVLPSHALALTPLKSGRGAGTVLKRLAEAFRGLPIPVIGTVSDGALRFDLRCLEDEQAFFGQLAQLRLAGRAPC